MRKLPTRGLAALILVLALSVTGLVPTLAPTALANAGTQWNAAYFNNTSLSGSPIVSRIDDEINFNWASGSPAPEITADNFSARWTKTVNFPTSGAWTFRVGADDGIRMWIDVTPVVDEWHGNPGGYRTYEATIPTLTAGNHDLKVEFYEETGNAGVKVEWFQGGGTATTTTVTPGQVFGAATWNASYFNNNSLSGSPVLTRVDNDINFNWGTGSPAAEVPADNFSARWTTRVNIPATGHWLFQVGADDGVRMWIDVTRIVDAWHGSSTGYQVYDVDLYALTAGEHDLKVEYYEATGNAQIQVRWQYAGGSGEGGGGAAAMPTPPPPATVIAAATGNGIYVRSGPGRGYPWFAQINYPKGYNVLGAVPDLSWVLIDLGNGQQGWVSNQWVYLYALEDEKNLDTTGGGQPDFVDEIPRISQPVAPPALPPSVEEESGRTILTGQARDVLNVRDGPSSTAAKVIATIPGGATFQVEAHNGNGAWYLVNYEGIRGWVYGPSVRLLDGYVRDLVVSREIVAAPPRGQVFVPEQAPGVPVTVRGRATQNLNFRNAASVRGTEIGEVPKGTEFVIEGRSSNGAWYLITFEGQPGWVYSPNVHLFEGSVWDLPIR